MSKKRIIPCLDIKNGRTVKGVNFVDIRDAGDPVELAAAYVEQGADELAFLNITATNENKKPFAGLVEKIAARINLPFTVGGGITGIKDVALLLEAGADKISINSAAVRDPALITELAKEFGSKCVVVAIDTDFTTEGWNVCVDGGNTPIEGLYCVDWAKRVEDLGAGEILLTSIRGDGTKNGFSIDITSEVTRAVKIPVIASGGAGKMEHFSEVFRSTGCSAALAASIFHFGEVNIGDLKKYLKENGINVRI